MSEQNQAAAHLPAPSAYQFEENIVAIEVGKVNSLQILTSHNKNFSSACSNKPEDVRHISLTYIPVSEHYVLGSGIMTT